jgi:UDP-N-acetylglucosamine:LPS N-acetylglucosamine transferase
MNLSEPEMITDVNDQSGMRNVKEAGAEITSGPVLPASTKRLLLVASSGGHWIQLSRLSPAFEGHDALYVTTLNGIKAPSGNRPVKVVSDASRSKPLVLAWLLLQLIWIFLRFRPHVIISTGAAPGFIALRLGRMLGSHTIWIDSLANSEELSLSGKMAESCADLWLTQWEHLAGSPPRLKTYGSVL